MVYKTVISDVAIKFAIANGGAQPEIKVPNTKKRMGRIDFF
jgi:hypothetical protein